MTTNKIVLIAGLILVVFAITVALVSCGSDTESENGIPTETDQIDAQQMANERIIRVEVDEEAYCYYDSWKNDYISCVP